MKNEYKINGEETVIYTNYKDEKIEFIIDTSDLELVSSIKGKWLALKHHSGNFYIRGPLNGKRILLHRFIMKPEKDLVVDHINHNPLDNRKSNLRVLTNAENRQNLKGARIDNSTGIRGVKYDKKYDLWIASVRVNGEYIGLGGFKTQQEAEKAAIEGRKKHLPYSTN